MLKRLGPFRNPRKMKESRAPSLRFTKGETHFPFFFFSILYVLLVHFPQGAQHSFFFLQFF